MEFVKETDSSITTRQFTINVKSVEDYLELRRILQMAQKQRWHQF